MFLDKKNINVIHNRLNKKYNFEYLKNKNMVNVIMKYIETEHPTIGVMKKNKLVINAFKSYIDKQNERHINFVNTIPIQKNEYHDKLDSDHRRIINELDDEREKMMIVKNNDTLIDIIIKYDDVKPDDKIYSNYFADEKLLMETPNEIKDYLKKMKGGELFKYHIVLIDSRSRNYDIHEQNKYDIHLKNILKNMVSIELKTISVPNSDYIINSSNNSFIFEETSGVNIIATIPEGNYNISQLLTEIQFQMNDVGSSSYTVSQSINVIISGIYTEQTNKIETNFGDGYKVFDNDTLSAWITNTNVNYFIYELDNICRITKYSLFVGTSLYGYPSEWTVEISNNRLNWYIVDTKIAQVYNPFIIKTYTVSNNLSGKYIRFNITNTSNSVDMAITEMRLFKSDNTKISFFSDLTGGDGIFNLFFNKPHGIKNVLGFRKSQYSSYNEYTTEDFYNINSFDNTIYFYLNNYGKIITAGDENAKIFTPLRFNNSKNKMMVYTPTDDKIIYTPDFTLSVDRLQISFKRFDGSNVNFNGMDHSFILKIKTLNIQSSNIEF